MPAVGSGAEVLVAPDGTVLVVGVSGNALQLVAGDRLTPIGPAADDVSAVLSPDARTVYAAASLPDRELLLAVDAAAGTVTATRDVPGPVADLAAGPDGVTLLTDAGLQTYDDALAPVGPPVELNAEGTPAGLALADDGTAVVTLADPAASLVRLVAVRGGRAGTPIEVADTEDSGADVALTPDGRRALLAQAAYGVDPELLTIDLATGEEISSVVLCVGAGDVGALALDATGEAAAAIGACARTGGPATTVFVVG
ncbi:hypothetical protein [Blastococcus sp. SYSU D00813]